jgi:transketolase
VSEPPYRIELKPYGRALVDLARRRADVLCLSGDLTRQTEVDLFQAEFPERFIHGGMAEANMMSMAGALARCGFVPFVHTFGVFATRRPYDQIANAIAYPNLPVRIIGFMPGVSTPGGPSHQATDDVALMRALPNMTVVDVADAVETRQVAAAVVDVPGPVYVRLKRGEIPVIFDDSHTFRLGRASVVLAGTDVALFASGMMLAAALAASRALGACGVSVSVINVPTIKPLDSAVVLEAAAGARLVVTAENHSIIGGLGSAVAETIAEAGLGRPLRRVGLRDTFAEGSGDAPFLFKKYGLSTGTLVETIWSARTRRARWAASTPLSDHRSQVGLVVAPVNSELPQARRLTHTETWAGSRACCTTPARSSRTESGSTASFRRAANAATVWVASYRARLNRRSTISCTRRRRGLNSAAAASVEAATATVLWNDSTLVASSTRPAYNPISRPVTIA